MYNDGPLGLGERDATPNPKFKLQGGGTLHSGGSRANAFVLSFVLVKGDEIAALFRNAVVETLLGEPRLAEQPALVPGSPIAQHRHCCNSTPIQSGGGGGGSDIRVAKYTGHIDPLYEVKTDCPPLEQRRSQR